MDKHIYREKTEQMLEYKRQKSYEKAMAIADTIDWRKVKNASMLCAVSEIYEANREYKKSRDILFLIYERSQESRKVIYRLGTLALKLGEVKEAMDCYEEFVALAPNDPNQYVFKYKILKSQNAPLEEQIEALEEFKKAEYIEKWAFELAKLYEQAGRTAECVEECDDLILWFSEGKYVRKALELKMQYKALTPQQQEKYNHSSETPVAAVEEAPAVAEEEAPVVAEEEAPAVAEEEAPAVAEEEQVVAEEAPVATEEEPVAVEEESVMEEEKPVITEDKPEEAPKASIEEMLQEWETKQKENAEMIRSKIEEAEHEKEEQEKAQEGESADSEKAQDASEDILPDDIRKLMEDLESESDSIEAEKIRQGEEKEGFEKKPEEKQEESREENQEEEPREKSEEEKSLARRVTGQINLKGIREAISSAFPGAAAPVTTKVPGDSLSDGNAQDNDLQEQSAVNELPIEDMGGVKLGDTQSMAAVAKALKNNVEVELPEEEEPYEDFERSPYDTGFVVKGRYDLEARSEVGLKAGLSEEQKKLFSYFVPVHGMSEQLVEVLENDKKCKARYGTSRIGNIVIIGRKGSGKTVLAVDVVKAIQRARRLKQGKVGIVTADAFNKKDISGIIGKLQGGAIIIENASKLSRRAIDLMCGIMEGQTGELLVVLEDERKPIAKLFEEYPRFAQKFTSRLEIPVFINDELVTFGQTYAKENGYKIDDMGILALYSRIDTLQREERIVTVADIKEIIDDAIEKSQTSNFRKLIKTLIGKNKDESDRIILREEDFR